MLELAFRSLSWLWALHFFAESDASDPQPWTVDLLLALDRQLTHVERNLSYYFSPNTHLLGEALALYVAGRALPELAASPRRADVGRTILRDEIGRQIASDGGHCERSAHYHRYTLDFYLLASAVARITHDPVASVFDNAVTRLAGAARLLADDNGRLPHLGDDDGGMLLPIAGRDPLDVRDSLSTAAALLGRDDLAIGAAPEETFWLLAHPLFTNRCTARTPNPRSVASAALAETGYYVSRSPDGTHAVVDGGPHGYQNGGHAHADALSLTLRLQSVPLLIDPGTANYTIDVDRRNRFRSTPMHNTVTIDDRSSSTPAGAFHWSQATDASATRWRVNEAFDYFEGAHRGFPGISHRRHVLLLHGDVLIVADYIGGAGAHTAVAHWHVHPRWRTTLIDRSVMLSASRSVRMFAPQGQIDVLQADQPSGLGWYSPAYGRVEPATTIRIAQRAQAPFWIATVFDLAAAQDLRSVEFLPVWAEAGALASSIGLRLSRASSTDYVLIAEASGESSSTWRIAEFETDAHMLFVRTAMERHPDRIALVDGSIVRSTGRHTMQVALPARAADLYLDPSRRAWNPKPGTWNLTCAESRDS